jgi:hypothetical protein
MPFLLLRDLYDRCASILLRRCVIPGPQTLTLRIVSLSDRIDFGLSHALKGISCAGSGSAYLADIEPLAAKNIIRYQPQESMARVSQ